MTVKRAALLIGDCANVIRDWHRGKDLCNMAQRAYGGLLVSQGRQQSEKNLDFLKAKAHRSLQVVRDAGYADDIRWAEENDSADACAKAGRAFHPQRDAAMVKRINDDVGTATQVCRTIAALLRLWAPIDVTENWKM